jgi:outer membrane lipoprotein SlyB
VRTIVPGANGHVASGAVTLSAVLVGRGADLDSASMSTDGADAGAAIDKTSPRNWTIHASPRLSDGAHTVRVQVRDSSGLAGGFTWQITVGGGGAPDSRPAPAPSPSPPA